MENACGAEAGPGDGPARILPVVHGSATRDLLKARNHCRWCIETVIRGIVRPSGERSEDEGAGMDQIIHPGDVPEGTLRAILKQAGITPQEFWKTR